MIRPDNLDQTVPVKCNTDDAELFANVRAANALDLPWLELSNPIPGKVLIVGGGPSVRAFLPTIKALQGRGHKICAINGTMAMLCESGVIPDYFVLLDARAESVRFLKKGVAHEYLISAQCNPEAFEYLKEKKVTVWHSDYEGMRENVDRECVYIGGGSTVGLQAMSIMFAMGYRDIHLYGFDSSYLDGHGHAYVQPENDADRIEEVKCGGRKFLAAPWMVRQAVEFQSAARQLADGDCTVTVHGSGLLPQIAHQMTLPALTVLTVYKSGGQFTQEYVTRLRDGVRSNLSIPHRFVCLTDDPVEGVECLPLEYGFPGWWSKAEIFRPDLPFGRTLYLDLSCVVKGPLDEMASQEGRIITKDWYHGGPSQSVLLYDVGDFEKTWTAFIIRPEKWIAWGDEMRAPDFGDQVLMNHTNVPPMDYWQDRLPGHLVSYKVHGVPPTARLIKFHGQPKPPDVGWLDTLPLAKAG